jgi:hypothetical protein
MTGPSACPYDVDLSQPRPKDVPPLLFNYRLHEGHGCGSEKTLREICRQRGYL